MNDQFTNKTNPDDEGIARKLNQVAEQTHANSQFAADLEERLRNAHQPKAGRLVTAFMQISPTLRWVALLILLAVVLNWSIKTLIPAPQPALNATPAIAETTTPSPVVIHPTETPTPEDAGYDWRGGKLHLSAPLPASPAEANLFVLQPDQHATVEEARALAEQFGIVGEIYQSPGELPDTTDFMVTDGKRRIYVRSKNYFTYYADYSQNVFLFGIKEINDDEARTAIDSFLQSHGFDFEYQIEKEYRSPGIYYIILLTSDGYSIRFDYDMPNRLQVTIGNDKQVIAIDSSQVDYETIGTYKIRSAEEAFQQVLGSADAMQNGVLESSLSGGVLNESFWERSYPENQTITIYGQVKSFNSVDPAKPALITVNDHTVTGNIPSASTDQLIEATGQFYTENGIQKFNIESWKLSNATETSVMGTLQRDGDQTILLSDVGDTYALSDVPADVPLNTPIPDEQLIVSGVLADGNLIWTSIQYFPAGSNFGGGGGGGTGFYQLNLSGTPVPFPSPTTQPQTNPGSGSYIVQEGDTCGSIGAQFGVSIQNIIDQNQLSANCVISVGQTLIISSATDVIYIVQENDTLASIALSSGISVDELKQANHLESDVIYLGQELFIPGQQTENPYIGRRFEKQRGTLIITIYNQADGSSRQEFAFSSKNEDGSLLFALLEDISLEALLPYQNRPIDIWGTIKSVDKNGVPVIAVEKYEAPYSGLTFQLVQGTQKNIDVDGATATIFNTDDGKSYIQMTQDGLVANSIVGDIGDQVYAEALFIPDETFNGYPTMRIFNMGLAFNPKNGEPATMEITADQPNVIDETLGRENYVPPDADIDRVELVYYIPDPRYVPPGTNTDAQYIQPAWRFHGHYSNGDEFEILVQALELEYLRPELATYVPPG